jgi:VanZ family protein
LSRPARLIAPLLWMAVIFYASSKSDPSPGIGDLGHVIGHFTEYAILAALWFWALAPSIGLRAAALAAWVICVVYAISDEWHQSFVPDRDSDPVDVLVDACGTAVAVAFSWWTSARRAALRRRPTSR